MSDLKNEAKRLIDMLPEEELAEILPELRARKAKVAKQAYREIHEIIERNRANVPAEFDDKEEWLEYLDERYGV